ncbi:LacI family DNA-binding transcriptional regulator [Xylanimonas protaetiae]|uniref:LacI family transcriptional regulator n=1 Tax=Xylanimonas protaetiae TaxID=2509457 RepID=A0A4P6F3I8_9MICO|nr:LacI family DNA-binding transcriptional regulator [Xylanimonas protaetiae]QAY69866.1 LacI family transcriptional regulator [Xylanimonas protaetiae]
MTSLTLEPPPDRGATIAQIAQELGVSVPTVSKVLNGRSDVAAETRARVEEALERHHYQRRKAAPPQAGTGLIDLVFHRLGSSWSMEIIRGVEDTAAAGRLSVILSELGGVHRLPRTWLDATLLRPPLGVLTVSSRLTPAQQRQLERRGIPFVVIDTDGEPTPDVHTVGSDNWNGGLIATRHLLALGHRRIAAVSGPADMLCSRARLDGFRSAHAEAGVAMDDDLILPGNFYVESGYRAAHDLLTRADRPTAIFAGSDMAALGVLRAAHELGLNVPRDVSVVGYDDLSLAAWATPALTTVRQPLAEMGAMATGMLIDLIEGRQPSTRRINLATELVVRESTTAPA